LSKSIELLMNLSTEAAPSRPFVLLDDRAMYDVYSHNWGMVECECQSKVAYGCGPLDQQIVEGLTLLVDLSTGHDDEHGIPCLAVHATDEVLRRFEEEEMPGELAKMLGRSLSDIDDQVMKLYGTKVLLIAGVEAVDNDGGVLVLDVTFVHDNRPLRSYHLVYDRDAASLSLLPYVPTHCRTAYNSRPLLVRPHGSDGYSLALMAVEEEHGRDVPGRPVVCLWTPQSPSDGDVGPWRIRERRHATEMLEPDFDRDRVTGRRRRLPTRERPSGLT
jgi:hypothetical protein